MLETKTFFDATLGSFFLFWTEQKIFICKTRHAYTFLSISIPICASVQSLISLCEYMGPLTQVLIPIKDNGAHFSLPHLFLCNAVLQ